MVKIRSEVFWHGSMKKSVHMENNLGPVDDGRKQETKKLDRYAAPFGRKLNADVFAGLIAQMIDHEMENQQKYQTQNTVGKLEFQYKWHNPVAKLLVVENAPANHCVKNACYHGDHVDSKYTV